MRTVRVGKFRVPITTALRGEIEKIVDGGQQVDSPFFDIHGHPGVCGVRMTERAVAVPREDRDGRVLPAFGILAAQIVFECAVAATEQPKVSPPSSARLTSSTRRGLRVPIRKQALLGGEMDVVEVGDRAVPESLPGYDADLDGDASKRQQQVADLSVRRRPPQSAYCLNGCVGGVASPAFATPSPRDR